LFVDDLAVKGFIGTSETISETFGSGHVHNETRFFLYTHLDFSIAYNGGHIIAVNVTTDQLQRTQLKYGADITAEFSYSVKWIQTDDSFMNRLKVHSASLVSTGEQSAQIHWLSIINSLVLVLLLTAFLAVILVRTLRKDIAGYLEDDEELGAELEEDSGWKLVHGDVFRPPQRVMLFAACVGTGAQLLALAVSIILLAILGNFYPHATSRGTLYTAAIIFYALTAGISGYVSTSLYLRLGGKKWATNAVLAACLYAVPLFITFSVVNSIAISYGSTSALPFGTVLVIMAMWGLVTFPLTLLGSMRARRYFTQHGTWDPPCRPNRVEREVPPVAWFRTPAVQMILAGFLPFSAIYIELHYVFVSIWGAGVYTLYGILGIAFVMLLVVAAFITVALTYFQLAAEDYRWWWRSFLSGGSTGFFIYAYAIFFYMYRAHMTGTLQTSFFFGYVGMVSYGFFLMLGSVGFWMSDKFVTYIYTSVKVD
jgi:transmembrane 9 superfamily member 1